jgi:6-phosphogluconolactonase
MAETYIQIFKDSNTLNLAAAEHFSKSATNAVIKRGRFLATLAGGNTPLALFHLLAAPPYCKQLPWSQIHFFWGDERCVRPDDPQSNFYQAWQAWLAHVPLREENLHRIKGELDPMAAVRDYGGQLKTFAEGALAWPRLDWVLLGLGEDGHTASLFPGSPADIDAKLAVIHVTAGYEGRPAERVSLTPNVFNAARKVVFLATGEEKARALATTLTGRRDALRWPAQRIHPSEGEVWWFVDEAAIVHLPKSFRL